MTQTSWEHDTVWLSNANFKVVTLSATLNTWAKSCTTALVPKRDIEVEGQAPDVSAASIAMKPCGPNIRLFRNAGTRFQSMNMANVCNPESSLFQSYGALSIFLAPLFYWRVVIAPGFAESERSDRKRTLICVAVAHTFNFDKHTALGRKVRHRHHARVYGPNE